MQDKLIKLERIYDKGITKTWWKSNLLDKINSLRTDLEMPLRSEALEPKHYDSEVVNVLKSTDFSELGSSYNLARDAVLTFAGIGFAPAPLVEEPAEVNLSGQLLTEV